MEEATVVRFFKQPGEAFQTGDPIYEIETEKVTQEIDASADGRMLEHCVAEGDTVMLGGQVCVVDLTAPGR